ncbi:MAG: metallophosphoesterase family protein [Planctomycetota bacterium]
MNAIISDIHGNLTALEAVLADIDAKGIERIICLGDVVGYGPDPVECIDLVRKRCEIVIRGNHDLAAITVAFGFHRHARAAIDWTRGQLKSGGPGPPDESARWEFLEGLPERHEEGRVLYVHGSPRDPVMEYVAEDDTADIGFGPSDKIREVFSCFEWLCFVGHTHRPGVFTSDFKHIHPSDIPNGVYLVPEDGKTLVNVGSVGQPRDHDARSCYVTLDRDVVQYHRVAYAVEEVIAKIEKIDELDDRLGTRLEKGR